MQRSFEALNLFDFRKSEFGRGAICSIMASVGNGTRSCDRPACGEEAGGRRVRDVAGPCSQALMFG